MQADNNKCGVGVAYNSKVGGVCCQAVFFHFLYLKCPGLTVVCSVICITAFTRTTGHAHTQSVHVHLDIEALVSHNIMQLHRLWDAFNQQHSNT